MCLHVCVEEREHANVQHRNDRDCVQIVVKSSKTYLLVVCEVAPATNRLELGRVD